MIKDNVGVVDALATVEEKVFPLALIEIGDKLVTVPPEGSVGKAAAPGQASIALASVSSIGFFGFLIGPPIVGFLAEAMGLRGAFLVIAILGVSTFIQSNRLKKYL